MYIDVHGLGQVCQNSGGITTRQAIRIDRVFVCHGGIPARQRSSLCCTKSIG